MKLSEIINRCGSDKDSYHSYGALYDEILAPMRDSATAVLEVGIYGGASVRAWQEFFLGAHVIGVDLAIHPCVDTTLPSNRYTGIVADQRKPEMLYEAAGYGPYDFIIDDGCHEPMVQVATFAVLYKFVKPGGIYVIEDVQRIEDAQTIAGTFGGELHDRRAVRGRADDILVVWRKP